MNSRKFYYNTELRKRRNRQLVDMYREALSIMRARGVTNPHTKALRWVVYNGSPAYHVSYERAYAALTMLDMGQLPCREGKPALEMWREIWAKVKAMQVGIGVSRAAALDYVLRNCRASRFFISMRNARDIVRSAKSNVVNFDFSAI